MVLKFPSDGSSKVTTVVDNFFRNPTTYFESLLFLQDLSVVDKNIKNKKIIDHRHYLVGSIVEYSVKIVFLVWNRLTRQ